MAQRFWTPAKRWWTAAALAIAIAVGALVMWSPWIRFQAHRIPLSGTPFVLLVQPGVADGEVAAIEDGLRAQDRYLRTVLGQGVTGRVEVRIARNRGCKFGDSPAGPPTAWADRGRICVNTKAPGWRTQYRQDTALAAQVVAHEHVHNRQAELGCLREPENQEYLWLVEGMAVHLGFAAMVAAGHWSDAEAAVQLRRWGVTSPGPQPLKAYEHRSDGDASYALFWLAVRDLTAKAARPDALFDFCRLTGSGTGWREAFTTVFGMPVDTFYAGFEQRRPQLIAAVA